MLALSCDIQADTKVTTLFQDSASHFGIMLVKFAFYAWQCLNDETKKTHHELTSKQR